MTNAEAAGFLAIIGILTWFFPLASLYLFVLVSPIGVVNDLLGWDPRVRWALLLCFRAAWDSWKSQSSSIPSRIGKPWIAFSLFAAAGLRFNTGDLLPDQFASAESLFLYFVAASAATYAIWQLVRTRRQLRALIQVFAASVSLAAVLGLLQAIVDYRSLDPSGRISGPLQNPNYFATYLAVAATTLVLLSRSGAIRQKYGMIACSLAATACVLTLSRIGILAALVGICMAAFVEWDKKLFSFRMLAAIGFVILVGIGLLTTYVLQFRRSITYSDEGRGRSFTAVQAAEDLSRLEALQYSVQLTAEHPVTGVGFGTFADRNYQKNGLYVTTHNSIMEVVVGTGVVGTVCILWLLITLVRPLPEAARRFLAPAAAAFAMCALFGDYLQSLEIFVVFAVLYSAARCLRVDGGISSSEGRV